MPKIADPRHNLRMSLELKKKIAHSAIEHGRSMNAEILARLEASFAPDTKRVIEDLLRTFVELDADNRHEAFALLARAIDILNESY